MKHFDAEHHSLCFINNEQVRSGKRERTRMRQKPVNNCKINLPLLIWVAKTVEMHLVSSSTLQRYRNDFAHLLGLEIKVSCWVFRPRTYCCNHASRTVGDMSSLAWIACPFFFHCHSSVSSLVQKTLSFLQTWINVPSIIFSEKVFDIMSGSRISVDELLKNRSCKWPRSEPRLLLFRSKTTCKEKRGKSDRSIL